MARKLSKEVVAKRNATKQALYDYLGFTEKDDNPEKILKALLYNKLHTLSDSEKVIAERVKVNLPEYL